MHGQLDIFGYTIYMQSQIAAGSIVIHLLYKVNQVPVGYFPINSNRFEVVSQHYHEPYSFIR